MTRSAPPGGPRRKRARRRTAAPPPPPRSAPAPMKSEADKGALSGALKAVGQALGFRGAPEPPAELLEDMEVGAMEEESELFSEGNFFSDSDDAFEDAPAMAAPPPPAPASAPPPSAPRPARRQERAPEDPAGALARTQSADGSFGGDVGRTAAALVTLLRAGHTRRKGNRRRAVMKAARWLQGHAGDPLADLALALLAAAERGEAPQPGPAWAPLYLQGVEGAALRAMG